MMNDRDKNLDTGANAMTSSMGRTIQRLRKSYNLSLSELSEQSGVAKSIISQIERNETNPTLATIWRLSQALDVSIEKVLQNSEEEPFLEHISKKDTPLLISNDKKCSLAIIGWAKTLEWLQWYDFKGEAGGVLDSEGHQIGSIESLSVLEGEIEVEVSSQKMRAKAGESLRYHCDKRHIIRVIGDAKAQATMVVMLKAAVME